MSALFGDFLKWEKEFVNTVGVGFSVMVGFNASKDNFASFYTWYFYVNFYWPVNRANFNFLSTPLKSESRGQAIRKPVCSRSALLL